MTSTFAILCAACLAAIAGVAAYNKHKLKKEASETNSEKQLNDNQEKPQDRQFFSTDSSSTVPLKSDTDRPS